MDKLGYSVEDAAPILGVGRTTIFELIATGQLESVKIGRRRIIPADALQRLLEQLRGVGRSGAPAA